MTECEGATNLNSEEEKRAKKHNPNTLSLQLVASSFAGIEHSKSFNFLRKYFRFIYTSG